MVTSISFWLSIVAFGAVVMAREYRFNIFWASVWVTIWLTPILALSFGKVSLVGPVLNILAVVAVEIITIVGGMGMIVGLLIPIVGKIMMWSIYPLAVGLVEVVEIVGGMSWSSLNIRFNWMMLVGWYMVLGYFLIKKQNPSGLRPPPLDRGGNPELYGDLPCQGEKPRRGEGFDEN